jgi:hypothetical protein
MFRSKAFSAQPVYFLRIAKRRPDFAAGLSHRGKDDYLVAQGLDPWAESVINEVRTREER